MIKKIILLACLATSCVFAQPNSGINNTSQIGRYQICANDKALFLVETDTGKIWVAEKYTGTVLSKSYPAWHRLKLELPQDINP